MPPRKYATLLPPPAHNPGKALIEQILEITPLSPFGPDIFTNASPPWHPPGARGIFGGAAIAYCLAAAQATMPPQTPPPPSPPSFAPHSFHCYFLMAGQPDTPIILHVERVRDGRSFATRTVQARQGGHCIFTVTISFVRISMPDGLGPSQVPMLEHAYPMPADAKPPPTEAEIGHLDDDKVVVIDQPFQHTAVEICGGSGRPHERACRMWMRARGKISGGMDAHLAALAYVSDSFFLATIPRVHMATRRRDKGNSREEEEDKEEEQQQDKEGQQDNSRIDIGMMVSLDHTMYFHNPAKVRADEWMLRDMRTWWAGDGRGLVVQRIYARDGTLLATCMQEGVVKLKGKAPKAVEGGHKL